MNPSIQAGEGVPGLDGMKGEKGEIGPSVRIILYVYHSISNNLLDFKCRLSICMAMHLTELFFYFD